jgi:hypothetical protein
MVGAAMKTRIKSGELSPRFGVAFSAFVTNSEHAQEIHSPKPGRWPQLLLWTKG